MTMQQPPSQGWLAHDGQTYRGQPPPGFWQASDGRWYPPQRPANPMPDKNSGSRAWWQKKRFLIPAVFLFLAVVATAVAEDPEEQATDTVPPATTEASTTSTTTATTIATTEASTTSATTATTIAATPDSLSAEDLEDVAIWAFRLSLDGVLPGVAGMSDEAILSFGSDICEAARSVDTGEQFGLAMLVAWEVVEPETQAAFDDDPEVFAMAAGAAAGAFCPDELERLGA